MANCLNCSKEVVSVPGRRPRLYCSDPCRQKDWQRKKKKEASKSKKISIIPSQKAPLTITLPKAPGTDMTVEIQTGNSPITIVPPPRSFTPEVPKKMTFKEYLDAAKICKDPAKFKEGVLADKSLNSNQQSMIYAKLKK